MPLANPGALMPRRLARVCRPRPTTPRWSAIRLVPDHSERAALRQNSSPTHPRARRGAFSWKVRWAVLPHLGEEVLRASAIPARRPDPRVPAGSRHSIRNGMFFPPASPACASQHPAAGWPTSTRDPIAERFPLLAELSCSIRAKFSCAGASAGGNPPASVRLLSPPLLEPLDHGRSRPRRSTATQMSRK